ncbi:adenylate/guanylate cyclase domain-containing protein [Neolewinella persica]|uniref:adenylate/guanylate cyclase domain-containing protein n=1 Tax=Neolewinella persica TaxID=70998 RepID=UPI0003A63FF5|nr:adenylate/guanylate cyclase domain-containing protein [Neolewinella persica]
MRKIKLQRIIIIALTMTLVGGLQALYDYAILTSLFSLGPSALYQFQTELVFNLASGFGGGLVAGVTLNLIDNRFRTKPYYQSLIILVSMFILVWAIRNTIEGLFQMEEKGAFYFSFDATDIKNIVFWMIIVILAYFFLEMNNKFGPGKLGKIFLGKFNTPVEEERIFMFLDLKSSTTIAEQLGGVAYHLFLKELFSDVTAPILETGGEIYQYVGDEIVLSWEVGHPENSANCIRCFFAIQQLLDKEESKYLRKFGVKPHFKAGAHYGSVIVGEIGVIKRDITYSGDVLNTTARIQGMCNELETIFLMSKSLFELAGSDASRWTIERKGKIPLKGKKEAMDLMSVELN